MSGAPAPEEADFNRRQGLRPVGRPARRMNSASRGLWPVVGLRRPGKAPFASAEADARRAAPEEADFNRRQGLRPVSRPARRMNSASRGLWPVVGLRRPGKAPFASAEADARRAAPEEADFNRRQGLRPVSRPARRMNSASRGLWPVVGLRRPGKAPFASAEADARRAAPEEADFNRRQGLRPVSRLRRPGKRSLRRQRPTPGAQRLKRPISIGFQGRRLARSAFEGRFQSAPGWRSGLSLLPAPVIESRCPETADGR
jgi:hypothetical protein